MNNITTDLTKGKNCFAEFVFAILTPVRNILPQNFSKLINQKPHFIPINASNSFMVFFEK